MVAEIERAEFVLEELSAALEWVCDDGKIDEKDAKLSAIVEAHRDDPDSEDALASELADYAGLARELKVDLAGIGGFDPGLIEEADHWVLALRERSAVRARGRNGASNAKLVERNKLASLLMARIGRVRAAARYVFRHHDEIVKQATNAYQRRRRAAARKRASMTEAPVVESPIVRRRREAGDSLSPRAARTGRPFSLGRVRCRLRDR